MSERPLMRKIILGWVLLALAFLVPATVLGFLFKLVCPSVPESTYYYGGRAVPPSPVAARPVPVRDEVMRRVSTGFSAPVTPDPVEQAEMTAVLQAVSETDALPPGADWNDQFDHRRMAEEELPLGFYRMRNALATEQTVAAAAASIRRELEELHERQPNTLPRGAVQVVRVGWSDDRNEALVIAKHTAQQGNQKVVQYVRWWLTRATGAWQIYDFEFADTRLRFLAVRNYLFSRTAKGELAGSEPANRNDVTVFNRYQMGVRWLALAGGSENDPAYDRAREVEADFTDAGQIESVIAARKAFQQRLAALAGKPKAAETYFTVGLSRWRDTPHRLLAAATGHNNQKRYAEALKSIKDFRTAIGDDPEAYREEAKARTGLANDPKAGIAVIQMGLLEFPGDQGLLLELARRMPADEREAVGEMIARTATSIVLLTAGIVLENSPNALDAICTGFLRANPNDHLAQMHAVHAKVALGQFQPAAELLKTIRDANRVQWPAFRSQLTGDPRVTLRQADYYRLFADIGEADDVYRTLARRYVQLDSLDPQAPGVAQLAKNLDALNGLHAAKRPNDPELRLWKAVVLSASNEVAKADAELAAAMKTLKPPATGLRMTPPGEWKNRQVREWGWDAYRRLRTRCLLKLGKWQQAYDDLPPAEDTFDQLAAHFHAEADQFALGELIERHAKRVPTDPELIFWRGVVDFLKKNYGPALKRFKEHRTKIGKEAPHRFAVEEYSLRTLIRLDRPDDALAFLHEIEGSNNPLPVWRAVVAAARTDADGVLEVLDQFPWAAAKLYLDPDAGPALRKPEFARVRQKYPPPVR